MSAPAVQDPPEIEGELGVAWYLCPHDDTEWSTRAVMIEGNMDPAALGNGDTCPRCGEECDQVTDWEADTHAGYLLWFNAPGLAR